ncbi:hypothetical protein SLNSH_08965 [Alsobacter soli]|uniref:Uncharacterized protein n=1 Tax=Alsobacter soli TaxID=2109933 RepID=A0A2T1HUH8_9HYPH|nr:class I SAM-dependent methyltransferase [Alsobacter soli]PSC05323.1 hypothetical protein SLNSH_08965 [Alsobacter soli]
MRLGASPEGLLERLAVWFRWGPKPVADTHAAFLFARIVMAAADAGVFEALADGPLGAQEAAARLRLQPRPLEQAMRALAAQGYLIARPDGRYALTRGARQWLLADSADTVVHKLAFQRAEWAWTERLDGWLRDGAPVDMHASMGADDWRLYQRAMRDMAAQPARELARRLPLRAPARMLDLAGGHGLYAAALCRAHPGLSAVVLERAEALPEAQRLLARERMGARVRHHACDILADAWPAGAYDVILLANVAHHLTEGENLEVARRAAGLLAPGGAFVVVDHLDQGLRERSRIAPVLSVFFGLTSASGTWPVEAVAGWMREAGLEPAKPLRFLRSPGLVALAGRLKRRRPAGPSASSPQA